MKVVCLLSLLLATSCYQTSKTSTATGHSCTPTQSRFTSSESNTDSISGNNHQGMVLIPEGSFVMGGDDAQAWRDEYPKHEVQIDSFWMDIHEVTNAQFAAFVAETGYITTAEKAVDWEDLKKELPPGTPKPDESLLAPAS
jgi:sulfatase modifying factor 1